MKNAHPCTLAARRSAAGFSLVELLVAVVIGMALTLAITGMLVRSEADRRTTTSVNDTSQNAAFLAYTLDRTIRSAGSGYAQAWRQAFGCRLLASRSSAQVLPRTSAFPAPFAGVPQNVRLAPLVIHAGAGAGGSDVLAIHTGASGLGENPMRVLPGSVTGTLLRVPSTVGLLAGDLVLVLQDSNNCMLQQVAAGFAGGPTQAVNFGGVYASSTINSIDLSSLGVAAPALLAPLGNVAGNQPSLQLVGIGDNDVLSSFDILRLNGSDAATPIADGVVELRALYGIDSILPYDGRIDTWVSPSAAPWDAATLLDGSVTSRDNLSRILAVRIGVVLRGNLRERNEVSRNAITLFGDLGPALQLTRLAPAAGVERELRYETLEITVPLRNVMLKPAA